MKTVKNTYRVAGTTFHEKAFEELGRLSDDYGRSAKDLIADNMEDERIFRYDFNVNSATLQPDPDNEHDRNAVKVLLDGILVGYIKRGEAKHIRSQLEAGNIVSVKAEAGGGPWKKAVMDEDDDGNEFCTLESDEEPYWVSLTVKELVEEGIEDQQPAGQLRRFYCRHCGAAVSAGADFCPCCGKPTGSILEQGSQQAVYRSNVRESKSRVVAALLCLFLGGLGAHRFYTGKYISGVLYILTFGGFLIGIVIDFIRILCGAWTDQNGYPLE